MMIDLGPHAAFIWLSYAAAALVVMALIVWAFGGEARARAKLAELERRGIVRRSRRGGMDTAGPSGSPNSDRGE
jgi:heme exporter protein D